MGHLGNFGAPREELQDTFGWLGKTFRIHPDFSDLNLVEFMRQAVDIDEGDERTAMDLVMAQFGGIVHPDEFDTFLSESIAGRQNSRDLMGLMKSLNEALAGRPTRRPSDSPSGRRKTKGKSKGASSNRARDGGTAKAVIRRLETAGRPDLALTVVEAVEQQRAG